MTAHGFIDFTDAHVQRVERTTYEFTVIGSTLADLGAAAQRQAHTLYGSYAFRINSLDVGLIDDPPDVEPRYHARVWTEAI